jgi:acid phosphatase type 7
VKNRLIVVLAVTAIGLAACKESPTGINPSSDDLALRASKGQGGTTRINSISVAPSSASIQAGASVQLTATSKPSQATTFAWASSNTSVATVSQTGLVTGVAAGSATVTASAGGKSGSSVVTVTAAPPPGSEVIVGAGDISDCNNNNDEATAKLLDVTPGTVVLMGDNVYESGSTAEYNNCYNPTWGRHKARTKPSAGNHEYNTLNATGYYGYFGVAAGDPTKGYYSYDLGEWHVVVLNSNLAHDALSPQIAWLRSDLTANTKSCTLAYWHHPRYSSGSEHGNNLTMQPYWDVLYEFNAEVILNGHDHDYERFAPQNASGAADNVRGIREFVVGTGGRALYTLGVRKANSEVFNSTTFGVIKMTLSPGSYSWQFIPIAGNTFTDSGSTSCH